MGTVQFYPGKSSIFITLGCMGPFNQNVVRTAYVRTTQNDKSVTCSCVPNCFSFVLWARLAGTSVQTYEKW